SARASRTGTAISPRCWSASAKLPKPEPALDSLTRHYADLARHYADLARHCADLGPAWRLTAVKLSATLLRASARIARNATCLGGRPRPHTFSQTARWCARRQHPKGEQRNETRRQVESVSHMFFCR